ncbi:bacterial alpha-L-rhamnosidase-domain-containing protein [Dioszegia hungarica]|uniref:alpha-L-rhamnosidase n=1 Tax=Dioszegia hungarica TaxID=4972 RepID=A0AA38HH93_9TREE|nr:bacterial alpha-L-rhamnosidase-domain-containing protein [Dioszegia hungarica]KAI9639009.1 bacterial alpha-L-rhamnosidase-domain-containing protein [Dioszegia hungarica]
MACEIIKVTLERYDDPSTLQHPTPRISWRFGGDVKDWYQTSYYLRLERDGAVFDHHVESQQSIFVAWPFAPLVSRQRFELSVRAAGTTGGCTPWHKISGEAALMDKGDWEAAVTHGPVQETGQAKRPFLLRINFTAPANRDTARLYITALGVYRASLNGIPVGDHCLAPGWQSYKHRLHYQSFDIAALLADENELVCWMGEGWYAGRLGWEGGWWDSYGEGGIGLIAQLEAGGKTVVATGRGEWEWAYGQLISSELYDGEVCDMSQSPTVWAPARSSPLPQARLISPESPPVRRTERLPVLDIITTPSGKTILDFGQNLVGWVRFLATPSSPTVVLRHAEVLEHGELGTRPLRECKATDRVTGGQAGWEPSFTFHGFRYVEVEGWDTVTKDSVEAVVICTDMARLGDFRCSHAGMTKYHENTVWGLKGNFVSVPTDCPQRDERMGWTGDLCAFAQTASFLYDTLGMLGNWLEDLSCEQLLDHHGTPPLVVPNILKAPPPTYALWGDVTSMTPYDLHRAFGDIRVLEEQWESAKAWLDTAVQRAPSGLWTPDIIQLGDWLDPAAPADAPNDSPSDSILVANAVLIHTTRTAATIAGLLGKEAEAERYGRQAETLTQSFRDEYVTPSGRVVSDTQATLALALHYGLIPKAGIPVAAERLAYLVRKRAFKICTGFAGTPIILPSLVNSGNLSIAYRMFQEKQCPSLLYPISMGATTIWERWDAMLPDGSINPGKMTSFNHYALGAASNFLYEVVGGISPLTPGWKRISIHPRPGGTVTSASVSHISPYGRVACEWRVEGGLMRVRIEVPPNSSALVRLPGSGEVAVGSGVRTFEVDWMPDPAWPPHPVPRRYNQTPAIDEIVE